MQNILSIRYYDTIYSIIANIAEKHNSTTIILDKKSYVKSLDVRKKNVQNVSSL